MQPNFDYVKLVNQLLAVRGKMTVPQIVLALNSELLPKAVKGTELWFELRRLIDQGLIDSSLIETVKPCAPLNRKESLIIKTVIMRCQLADEKLTFDEMAEKVLFETNCLQTIAQMSLKLKFLLIPLKSEDDDDEELQDET